VSGRKGDWSCTFTGRRFWPEDPRTEDVDPRDIAHALALLCRFGGHSRVFYSVAQHSVLVSYVCAPEDALWGLLHDASEAYLVDIPRPLKRATGLEGYLEHERRAMKVICDSIGLPHEMPASVKRADEILLATEARDLMPADSVKDWYLPEPPLERSVLPAWSPDLAEVMFANRLQELCAASALQLAAEIRDLEEVREMLR
jgi:hypothetical protein